MAVPLASWCALRFGEMIELRRTDIGKGCEVIMVSRAATHRGKGCRIDMPKSGKADAVVVPPHIRADVKHHLDLYVAKEPDALIFPALRYACHFNDSVFAKHFSPALKTIGREGVRIHDLRHFAGTQAARVGSITEVMDRLGHSTPRASLMYQGMASGRARELADALSELAAVKPDADGEQEPEATG
jgi:integrase